MQGIRIAIFLFLLNYCCIGQMAYGNFVSGSFITDILHRDLFLPDSLKGVKKITTETCKTDDTIINCQTVECYYCRAGFLTDRIVLNQNGKIDEKKIYRYNNFGQIEKYESYNNSGTIIDKEQYKYDNKNRLIEFCDYDDNGKIERRLVCFYDSINGLLKREIQYKGNGRIRFIRDYSSSGTKDHYVNITVTNSVGCYIKTIRREYHLNQ